MGAVHRGRSGDGDLELLVKICTVGNTGLGMGGLGFVLGKGGHFWRYSVPRSVHFAILTPTFYVVYTPDLCVLCYQLLTPAFFTIFAPVSCITHPFLLHPLYYALLSSALCTSEPCTHCVNAHLRPAPSALCPPETCTLGGMPS